MDICSHIGTSVSEDVNSFYEFPVGQPQSTCRVTGDLSVNDLGNSLTEFLNIQGVQELVSGSIPPSGKNGVEKEDICEGPHQHKLTIVTSEKCLSRSATFPCSSKITFSAESTDGENDEGEVKDGENDIITEVLAQDGFAKSVNLPYMRSVSLPTPLKLVSAIKGSREKQGTPPKKLSVTWAPDVYDPAPTAVSHVVTNKTPKHRSSDGKKKAKNKQKGSGKTSRGSKGKVKNQVQKHGGSSNRCLKSFDVVDFDEPPQMGLVDYKNVGGGGGPDPYCGSSFLMKSVTKLHFSVAEAT